MVVRGGGGERGGRGARLGMVVPPRAGGTRAGGTRASGVRTFHPLGVGACGTAFTGRDQLAVRIISFQ